MTSNAYNIVENLTVSPRECSIESTKSTSPLYLAALSDAMAAEKSLQTTLFELHNVTYDCTTQGPRAVQTTEPVQLSIGLVIGDYEST